jgi:hypothetical protein
MTDAWDACSYCGGAVDRLNVDERCQFTNSDDYLCGKPAHLRCVEVAARESGLHAEKALCREHLHGGQWTRPRK